MGSVLHAAIGVMHEAGCGPLAGPVVAAAVILDRRRTPRGIDDSKALSEAARESLHARLLQSAVVGVGVASVEEIDALKALNILYDRDEHGEFRQAYTEPFQDRFFFEVTERTGHYAGFGAPNAAIRLAAQARSLAARG